MPSLPLRYPPALAEASALREAYSDATYFKDEALRAFKLGVLSLEERAQVGGAGAKAWVGLVGWCFRVGSRGVGREGPWCRSRKALARRPARQK